jgi:hypothetical protein
LVYAVVTHDRFRAFTILERLDLRRVAVQVVPADVGVVPGYIHSDPVLFDCLIEQCFERFQFLLGDVHLRPPLVNGSIPAGRVNLCFAKFSQCIRLSREDYVFMTGKHIG